MESGFADDIKALQRKLTKNMRTVFKLFIIYFLKQSSRQELLTRLESLNATNS